MTAPPQPPQPVPQGTITVAAYARWARDSEDRVRRALARAAERGEPLPAHETDPHTGKRRYWPLPLFEWLAARPSPGRPRRNTDNHERPTP